MYSGVAIVEQLLQGGVAQGAKDSLGGEKHSREALFFFKVKLFDVKK